MRFSFLVALVLCFSVSFAADGPFAAAGIPASLLVNANVVKRAEEVQLEIINTGEMVLHKKYALTILNENGAEYAPLSIGYDQFRSIKSFEGALYDANGKEIRKLKSKEIQDISAVDDNNLMDDSRMKVHSFNYNIYPYTVSYDLEIKMTSTYYLPPWQPQSYEHLSVEKSSFSLITPEPYLVRFKAFNYNNAPIEKTEKGKKIRSWEVAGLQAIEKPYASPKWNELTTSIYLAPSDFEMQQYKGNANSWESLGKFQIALNEGRDKLPDAIQQKVQELTAGVSDEKEKIKRLYQFLQQNTRYISIQLGIGGLQPFDASFVAQKGYGDCKALSNYMYSLLKAAGIKSYYTWAHAGTTMDDKYMMEDFPSDQFNHIIICVPLQKDSVWLECTSQTEPAGYMGGFTGNRKVLLITEDGGKLVSTPRYGIKENLQLRSIKGSVGIDGNLTMKVATQYTGLQQDNLSGLVNALSKEKIKKVLNEELDLSTYEINDFKYSQKKDILPQVDEMLDITATGYATVSGKRIFINPNILNRTSLRLTDTADRKFDYQFDYAYKDADTAEIEIPEGYVIELLPQDVTITTKFGTYKSSVKLVNNKLFYVRERQHFSGRYSAKEGGALAAFFNAIYKADRSKVVFVKKES